MERRKFKEDADNLENIRNHILALDKKTLETDETKMLKLIPEKLWNDTVAAKGYNRSMYHMLKSGKAHILDTKKSNEHGWAINWGENIDVFYKLYDLLFAKELANEFDNDVEPPPPYHRVMNEFRNKAYMLDITPNTYMETLLTRLMANLLITHKSMVKTKKDDDFFDL